MPSYYTVVQYVPDPIADERINIGVITYDGARLCSRFLGTWRRVQGFGDQDIGFLRSFASIITEASGEQLLIHELGRPVIDRAKVEGMSGSWINSIQFTPPRASTRDAGALLHEVAGRFLREQPPKQHAGRDRRAAGALAIVSVREAVVECRGLGVAKEFVRRNWDVMGHVDSHKFDVVVRNGAPIYAAHGISFEVGLPRDLAKDVAAVAWAFDDVRQRLPDLPLALVALPPIQPDFVPYQRARKMTTALRVQLVLPNRVEGWAREMAALVPVDRQLE